LLAYFLRLFSLKKQTKSLSWNTEKRKIIDLMPCSRNPRILSEEQRKQLTKSLQRFNLAEIPDKNFIKASGVDCVHVAGFFCFQEVVYA
jgi:hypothetical protein